MLGLLLAERGVLMTEDGSRRNNKTSAKGPGGRSEHTE